MFPYDGGCVSIDTDTDTDTDTLCLCSSPEKKGHVVLCSWDMGA